MRGFIMGSCAFVVCASLLCASVASAAPDALAPPDGATLIGRYSAHGVQIYACALKGGAPTWVLKAPEAELAGADGKPFANHSAGPTWTALDGSTVIGTLLDKRPAPQPGSIDWLLLSTISNGNGALTGTRFVQRLATQGGAAPNGPCGAVGQEIRVPYAADYLFYR